ncbi:MAG: TetR/AcrR family transcriptional regulator [Chloroflexi bacterium]|nr:TetR/AcrR family transcriptional regulator [Chloroflexota bacterium]
MTTTSVAQSTRQSLLDAASRVALRDGVTQITLEAVAREARVSKGGLLYHFPSKDALIQGMLVGYMESFDRELTRKLEESETGKTDTPGRWLRAFALAMYESKTPQELGAGLMAAAALNPELLAPARAIYARWQASAEEDGLDPALATMLRLAIDGLWAVQLLGLAPPNGSSRKQVLETILQLTRGMTAKRQMKL